jgi:hypothetical protein
MASAPSTTLRVVPLPASQEDSRPRRRVLILPRSRGRGTAEGGGGGVKCTSRTKHGSSLPWIDFPLFPANPFIPFDLQKYLSTSLPT